jgi:FkbM family methyltransferase
MTLRRAAIRALDRPGGRGVLGALVGRLARESAPGVRVYFQDGMWVHQQKDVVFVDAPTLDYHPTVFHTWANESGRCTAEAADHWFHVYKPRAGDIILDVGAGKGEDTIAFSRAVGPDGRVIAIEAHPTTFRCLRVFCELNRLHNVEPMHLAIVDRAGPVAIETTDAWQSNGIVNGEGRGSARVPGVTLDEVVERANLKHIDLLKMNIESAEVRALQGMGKTLQITRSLCISCHDFRANQGEGEFFRTKASVQDAVERAGFRIVSRDADSRPYVSDQVNGVRE